MSNNILDYWGASWFAGFCNSSELSRIANPASPEDYFLRIRADVVANSTRLQRVYLAKSRLSKDWSFEGSFATKHYDSVLSKLSEEDNLRCEKLLYGDMFSNDPNGFAWITEEMGPVVSLNESLFYVMYFSGLAFLEFNTHVPKHIRINAMRIAIKTMMRSEALDFEIDPRGIIPPAVDNAITSLANAELQFVAGHEFSHYLCGHLNRNSISTRKLYSDEDHEYTQRVFNIDQQQEFEADKSSLLRPMYCDSEYSLVLIGALFWFATLIVWEAAESTINPGKASRYQTHPSALDRFDNILNECKIPDDFNPSDFDGLKSLAISYGKLIVKDINNNYDSYETYGSTYLDRPNTKWRGRELVDRIDY